MLIWELRESEAFSNQWKLALPFYLTPIIAFVLSTFPSTLLGLIRLRFSASILVRRLLKHGSFQSTEQLTSRILAFIEYFNQTMAKPFKWKYQGQPKVASTA
jgi:hypothetical protein